MKEWIIPVVIAVIWILNAVLRNRENEEPVRVARGKLGERPDGRTPTSDIDRFLQEIEKMRHKGVEQPTEAPKVIRPAVPKVRPVTQSVPRVRPVTARVKTPAGGEVVPVGLVERPEVLPVRPRPQASSLTSPIAVPPIRNQRVAPALAGLVQQLRSPQSVFRAVALSEILGPPRSKRR